MHLSAWTGLAIGSGIPPRQPPMPGAGLDFIRNVSGLAIKTSRASSFCPRHTTSAIDQGSPDRSKVLPDHDQLLCIVVRPMVLREGFGYNRRSIVPAFSGTNQAGGQYRPEPIGIFDRVD